MMLAEQLETKSEPSPRFCCRCISVPLLEITCKCQHQCSRLLLLLLFLLQREIDLAAAATTRSGRGKSPRVYPSNAPHAVSVFCPPSYMTSNCCSSSSSLSTVVVVTARLPPKQYVSCCRRGFFFFFFAVSALRRQEQQSLSCFLRQLGETRPRLRPRRRRRLRRGGGGLHLRAAVALSHLLSLLSLSRAAV